MDFFLIAGEPSGDALGADLIRALQAEATQPMTFVGVGGPLMEAAGMKVLLPMAELSVMGLFEVLPQLPRLLWCIKEIEEEIVRRQPTALITIDFPDFNFYLGARLRKKRGFRRPHIHYVAPTVWAWRKGRAKAVSRFLDAMICLLPFEPPYFEKRGLKSLFVGHPITQIHSSIGYAAAFRTAHDIPYDAPVLGLLMGSRHSEITRHGRTLIETAIFLQEELPNLHLILPTLPAREYEVLKLLEGTDLPAVLTVSPKENRAAMTAMNAAVAVSGTVGLELAMLGVPHVVTYKLPVASYALARLCVKAKYAHLANIVLDQPLVPEYLQKNCDAEKIAAGVLPLFTPKASSKRGRNCCAPKPICPPARMRLSSS